MSETKKRISRSRSCRAPQRKDRRPSTAGRSTRRLEQGLKTGLRNLCCSMSGLERQLWRRRRSLCTRQRTWAAGNLSPTTRSPRSLTTKGVIRGGRAVAFEANTHHWEDGARPGYIRTGRAPGQVFRPRSLCVCPGRFWRRCCIPHPWSIWKDMKEIVGRKYVTPDDLEEYRLHIGPGRIIFIFD